MFNLRFYVTYVQLGNIYTVMDPNHSTWNLNWDYASKQNQQKSNYNSWKMNPSSLCLSHWNVKEYIRIPLLGNYGHLNYTVITVYTHLSPHAHTYLWKKVWKPVFCFSYCYKIVHKLQCNCTGPYKPCCTQG